MTSNNRQLDHEAHQSAHRLPLCILVKDMESPSNVGSIFRIADALGVEKIYLSGNTQTPPNSKIRKVSRAAEQYVPFSYEDDPVKTVQALKQAGYLILGLDITSHSIDLAQYQLPYNQDGEHKVCLILGSERSGISQALLAETHATVHIPMVGQKSSMNVGNACAIAVYSLGLQLRAKS